MDLGISITIIEYYWCTTRYFGTIPKIWSDSDLKNFCKSLNYLRQFCFVSFRLTFLAVFNTLTIKLKTRIVFAYYVIVFVKKLKIVEMVWSGASIWVKTGYARSNHLNFSKEGYRDVYARLDHLKSSQLLKKRYRESRVLACMHYISDRVGTGYVSCRISRRAGIWDTPTIYSRLLGND